MSPRQPLPSAADGSCSVISHSFATVTVSACLLLGFMTAEITWEF